MVYVYDKKNLKHSKLGFMILSLITLSVVFMSSISTLVIYVKFIKSDVIIEDVVGYGQPICKHDILMDEYHKDSIFSEYKLKADFFLKRGDFEGTPLNGDILSLSARNAYDSTGIIVPLELALSQCIWESSMGRRGKSPKNNPYNVGEYDGRTVKYFNSTFEGVQSYFYLVSNDYLKCNDVNALFTNYVNCKGYRYASEKNYESMVSKEYFRIRRWLSKNYNNKKL